MERGGLFERGLIYYVFSKTTMYSLNFNTTLNVLRSSTIYFSTIQLYICFKMFVTCMMRYVILVKMKTN